MNKVVKKELKEFYNYVFKPLVEATLIKQSNRIKELERRVTLVEAENVLFKMDMSEFI